MKIFVIGHVAPDLDSIASAHTYSEYLKEKGTYKGGEVVPVRAGEVNVETKQIFEKFEVEIPKYIGDFQILDEDLIVLVDHNEKSQRHESIPADQIVEILDHHKLNIDFEHEVLVNMQKVGTTNTIIYGLFEKEGIEPSEKTLKLMFAAILSDTVGLKSSTTAGLDSEVAHKLSEKLGLDIDDLTFEIFKAKSDISDLTPIQIAKKDFKVLEFSGTKVYINQVETVEPEKVFAQKEKLIEALNEARVSEGCAQGYLVVTDILNINSKIIYTNDEEKEVVEKAFATEGIENVADIGPRLSRKKDISPAIERVVVS